MPPWIRSRRGPVLALVATVAAAFLVLVVLSRTIPVPIVLSDELRYTIAAASLEEGDGLSLRGEEYAYGPVYPTVLATVLSLEPDRETAYPLFKVVNALLFALTAVPLYFLARRLLPPWWSVGVAGLSIAVPSSVYAGLVLTESAAYLVGSLALLAIVLALERPSFARQLSVVAAVAVAFLTRPQLAVLFVAYVGALLLLWAIVPERRPRGRDALIALWPVALLAIGVAAFIANSSTAYDELWGGYDVPEVARWTLNHLAGLELYLAVVPLVAAPVVLSRLLRGARRGSASDAAFAATFLAANVCFVLVAALFSSTDAGLDRLHDRYLFYVVPLWLVVLALWLRNGAPRPLVTTAAGVALALLLPAVVPYDELADDEAGAIDAVVTPLWAEIHAAALDLSPDRLSGRRVLALIVVALVLAAVLVTRRLALLLAAPVVAVVLTTTGFAWRDADDSGGDREAVLGAPKSWVDDLVGPDASVTPLYVSASCPRIPRTSEALLGTEFFNRAVDRAAHVAARDASLLPSTELRVDPGGGLVDDSGRPLVAEHVIAPLGVRLDGDVLGAGTNVRLVLWRVDKPVRAVRAQSVRDLQRAVCYR